MSENVCIYFFSRYCHNCFSFCYCIVCPSIRGEIQKKNKKEERESDCKKNREEKWKREHGKGERKKEHQVVKEEVVEIAIGAMESKYGYEGEI